MVNTDEILVNIDKADASVSQPVLVEDFNPHLGAITCCMFYLGVALVKAVLEVANAVDRIADVQEAADTRLRYKS